MPQADINEVTRLIQLAIAPVFLLTAVGMLIGVMTSFLTRTVDRVRLLQERWPEMSPDLQAIADDEIGELKQRMKMTFYGLMLNIVSALFIGAVIVIAFIDAFADVNLATLIALLFIAAMLCFISSLVLLLIGIHRAVNHFTALFERTRTAGSRPPA